MIIHIKVKIKSEKLRESLITHGNSKGFLFKPHVVLLRCDNYLNGRLDHYLNRKVSKL